MMSREKRQLKTSSWGNVRYILGMLWRGDKGIVIYSMFKAISENIFYVFFFVYLTKYIYTCIAQRTPFNEMVHLIILLCSIHVLLHISSAGHQYYLKCHTPEVYRYIFTQIIDKSSEMEYCRFEEPDFYDKFTRALNESVTRGMETLDKFAWLCAGVLASILASIVVIQVDWKLLILIVPSVISSVYFGSKAGETYYQLDFSNTRNGRTAAYVKRIFYEKKYAAELRLFNIADRLLKRHEEAYEEMYKRTKALRKKAAKYESIRWSIFAIMTYVLPFLYVAWVVKTQEGVNVGAYLAMATSLEFVAGNISDMVEQIVTLNKHGMFISNLREFLEYEPQDNVNNMPIKELCPISETLGDIAINNISFTYKGADKPTIHNLSLTIPKGSRIALVGYNGAGKTTLVKLLMRLYDVTEGEICISGKNIKDYDLKEYHRHLGTVFQDLQVFALPISENVLMHRPRNEEERQLVETALEKAQFGEKLKTLSNGIDTMVSKEFDENGVVLSGGEVQKIAIARIFAQNPDIVILDEPSSALDPIAEYNMYKNMMEIAGDKTVIFISHRLSSARVADRIYLMQEGAIAEEGTHDELMAMNGIYAHMFELQAQNYRESLPDEMEVKEHA